MAYLGVNDELWAVILPVCGNIMVYLHANFQPITHPIANVMANIRYRPPVAADQPTQARKFQKIPESKTFFWQIFTRQMTRTMQTTWHPKGNHRKYTKVRNSDFFRATVWGSTRATFATLLMYLFVHVCASPVKDALMQLLMTVFHVFSCIHLMLL